MASSSRRHWVQLAGGAKADRLPTEYERIKARKPKLFKGKSAHVAELKGWSRLLIGPFKTEEAAQEFVNELAGAGIKTFTWTNPVGQAVEKLAAK